MQGIAPALIFAIPANCLPNSGDLAVPAVAGAFAGGLSLSGLRSRRWFWFGRGHRHDLLHDLIADVDGDTHVIRFLDKVMIP